MRLTIKDVAQKAGVSKSTVSNVINARFEHVSKETYSHVCKVMEELKFRPNGVARSLVKRRTNVVGVIVADISRHPYPPAVRGIGDTLGQHGISLLLSSTDNDHKKEGKMLQLLHERQVDGIIVVSQSGKGDNSHLLRLAEENVPLVVINRFERQLERVSVINIDNESGAYAAAQHLLRLGHRHIACLHAPKNGPYATKAAIERFHGFQLALQEAGVSPNQDFVVEGSYRKDGGWQSAYEMMDRLLAAAKLPTAIFCANDLFALGVMARAQEAGVHIPDDLAVIGHDNTMAAEFCSPPLTTVEQPMYEAGVQAGKIMHAMVNGEAHPKEVTLLCRLMKRKSCGTSLNEGEVI